METSLREGFAQEGLARNLGNFTRFLEAASLLQAEVLSISEMARERHPDMRVNDLFSNS